jgi:MOSC domain-containing protein YiiM
MFIDTLSIGQPATHRDERGEWVSAIFRTPVEGRVVLTLAGHEGDRVADRKHHGSPDQAVCCQPLEHYDFWNAQYPGAQLGPAAVGENWTIDGGNEQTVCVGDVYRVGTARVQVSAPRGPCSKQERKVRLPGFLARTRETQRTGWYLRVLTPGEAGAGDELIFESRPAGPYTIAALNENWHGEFDPIFARELLLSPELAEGWKDMLRHRLAQRAD